MVVQSGNRNMLPMQQGFTLIEMMIVVAIIGILAAIAYPNYQKYVIKTKRADMMAEMQQIASRIESNKINYKRYDRIPLSAVFTGAVANDGTTTFPSAGDALYTVSITPINAAAARLDGRTWTVSAEPITGTQMAGDGTLTLDYQGKKCRLKEKEPAACGTAEEWQ